MKSDNRIDDEDARQIMAKLDFSRPLSFEKDMDKIIEFSRVVMSGFLADAREKHLHGFSRSITRMFMVAEFDNPNPESCCHLFSQQIDPDNPTLTIKEIPSEE